MKKLISLILAMMLALCAIPAMTENAGQGQALRVGELAYLNSDEATRAAMLMQIEGVLNKYERSILNYPSSVEVVAFDNLNAMQMALQSGQIDAMILETHGDGSLCPRSLGTSFLAIPKPLPVILPACRMETPCLSRFPSPSSRFSAGNDWYSDAFSQPVSFRVNAAAC